MQTHMRTVAVMDACDGSACPPLSESQVARSCVRRLP
jgi:hypothetical protein